MQDLWKWVSFDFWEKLKANKSVYNASIRETYSTFESYVDDASSILIGYPILRQLRVKKGVIFIIISSFLKCINLQIIMYVHQICDHVVFSTEFICKVTKSN